MRVWKIFHERFLALDCRTATKVSGTVFKTETGVDGAENILVEYKDGKIATLFTTIYVGTDRDGIISGRKGYIRVVNINNPEKIEVYELRRGLKSSFCL